MMLIFGLMLLQTAACMEYNCRFNQADPCYAALGHTLNLLMVDTREYDLKILKRINNSPDDPVCRVKNDRIRKSECDLFKNRSEVTVINGTLIINRVISADSGNYTFILYHSGGRDTSADLQVNVEGMEFNCRFNQAGPCYAALGHTLNLLMVDTRKDDLTIKKRINNTDDSVCRVKNDRIRKSECDLFMNRPEVTVINGTLIIKRVIRADSGNYTVGLQGSNGTVTSADLQVNVEAPIGSVNVSFNCSSNGVKTVSCSSDGDQLLYSWTLNGDPLMDRNANIQLNETTDGEIRCSVKNHISLGQKNINVNCPGSPTAAVTSSLTSTLTNSTTTSEHVCSEPVVFVLVWCFQMMVLFGLLGGFHIYMKHASGRKQEDQKLRMRRFREGHEHTAEDP